MCSVSCIIHQHSSGLAVSRRQLLRRVVPVISAAPASYYTVYNLSLSRHLEYLPLLPPAFFLLSFFISLLSFLSFSSVPFLLGSLVFPAFSLPPLRPIFLISASRCPFFRSYRSFSAVPLVNFACHKALRTAMASHAVEQCHITLIIPRPVHHSWDGHCIAITPMMISRCNGWYSWKLQTYNYRVYSSCFARFFSFLFRSSACDVTRLFYEIGECLEGIGKRKIFERQVLSSLRGSCGFSFPLSLSRGICYFINEHYRYCYPRSFSCITSDTYSTRHSLNYYYKNHGLHRYRCYVNQCINVIFLIFTIAITSHDCQ